MIRYFQSGYLSRYLLILILTLVLWIPTFFIQVENKTFVLPFYNLLIWLGGSNTYILQTVSLLITILSALILNNLCTEIGFTAKVSTQGAIIYILIASSLSWFTNASPVVFVNFLLLLMIRMVYFYPQANNHKVLGYNVGFLTGLAFLFYTPAILFLPFIWISFVLHRSGNWRIFAAAIIGAATPILFLFTWYFWNDNTDGFVQLWQNLVAFHQPDIFNQLNLLDIITLSLLTVLTIYAVFQSFIKIWEKNINLRRNIQITFYFLITSVLIVFLSSDIYTLQLVVIPASFITINAISNLKRTRFANILLSLFMVLIIGNQLFKLGAAILL